MIYCKKCGAPLPDDAAYCVRCGTRVELPSDVSSQAPPAQGVKQPPAKSPDPTDKQPRDDKESRAEQRKLLLREAREEADDQADSDDSNHRRTLTFFAIAVCFVLLISAISFAPSSHSGSHSASVSSSQSSDKPGSHKSSGETAATKKEAEKPPVTLDSVIVKTDSIGQPQVDLRMTNHSGKTIDAYKVHIYAYDNYGTQLSQFGFGDGYFSGISQDTVADGQSTPSGRYWTLSGFDNGRKFTVRLMSIHFSDGTQWTTEAGQKVTIDGKL